MSEVIVSFKAKQVEAALYAMANDARMQDFFDILMEEGVLLKVDRAAEQGSAS